MGELEFKRKAILRISRIKGTLIVITCIYFAMSIEASAFTNIPHSDSRDSTLIRAFAEQFLIKVSKEKWAKEWKGAEIGKASYVEQSSAQPWDTKLEPVWYAQVIKKGHFVGYMMWDTTASHHLLELGLDLERPLMSDGKSVEIINEIGNLQEFPVKGKMLPVAASGCVPTSAANVVAYWADNGYPQWKGKEVDYPKSIALRLRNDLPIGELKDIYGYSDNGMAMTGVHPDSLVKTLRRDANNHNVKINVSTEKYSRHTWQKEINAKRPLLLTCIVRLAHKPYLSWSHMVTGIGWLLINDDFFIIIRDNFYPTSNANAIRLLLAKSFYSIILVEPI